MSFEKIDLPHVFAYGITPGTAARAETDVVINLPIGHESARVFILARCVPFARKPRHVFDRALFGDEVIGLNTPHYLGLEGSDFPLLRGSFWIDSSLPRGN